MLEDALRDMFASRVDGSPIAGDPATAALHRAGRVRRRRAVMGSVAAAMVLVAALSGVVGLRNRLLPERTGGTVAALGGDDNTAVQDLVVASPSARPPLKLEPLGLDLLVGNQLWTIEGDRVPLTGVGLVVDVYRVPVGWVYGGQEQLRLLRPDHTAIDLVRADGRWLVSPEGDRVAYVVGDIMHIAALTPDGLEAQASAAVPAGVKPVAFLGDRVVVADSGGRGHALVDPERGLIPAWRSDVLRVYGSVGGGVSALVRSGSQVCLASLTATTTGLRDDRDGECGLGIAAQSVAGRLSFGGRWLAEQGRQGQVLIDLTHALDQTPGTVPCPVRSVTQVAWANATTLATADARGAVLCRTNGTQQIVPLPAGLVHGWRFVPRHAAATR